MGKVITTYKGDMLFESKLGGHRVMTDMPALMGGKDRAPEPAALFIAALGSCIGGGEFGYAQGHSNRIGRSAKC